MPAQTAPATTAKQRSIGAANTFPPRTEPRISRRFTGLSG